MKGLFDTELPHRSPAINDWLRHARPAGRRALNQYPELEGDDLIWEVVKENVLVQLKNLRSLPCVSKALARGQIKLHGWAYRIETGDILAYDEEAQTFESVGLPALPVVA
jgi:carbonic anhydrase